MGRIWIFSGAGWAEFGYFRGGAEGGHEDAIDLALTDEQEASGRQTLNSSVGRENS